MAVRDRRRGVWGRGAAWMPGHRNRLRSGAPRARAGTGRCRAVLVDFREGEADKIPFPDASFDAVLSTFGAMFAPDPQLTADELLRVCRAGGKIGMANWTPEGMIGEMFQIIRAAAPPTVDLAPPEDWGLEVKLRERFGNRISTLPVTRRWAAFRHFTPTHWVEFMKTWFGPTIVTFRALSPERGSSDGCDGRAGGSLQSVRRPDAAGSWRDVEVVAIKR